MAKSISVNAKKRRPGRPVTTGTGVVIGVRMREVPLAALDKWIEQQNEPDLSRPEAIRRLVELGLATAKPSARTPAKTADKAKELAALAIDGLVDPTAPAEEKAHRKSRLLKGPQEFRELRVDHAIKK